MNKLVIFGEAILAELASFYFDNDSDYSVCGFVADSAYFSKGSNEFLSRQLVSSDEMLQAFPPSEYDAFVAIGYSDMNRNREGKMRVLREKGYHLATYVSSKALYWNKLDVGENCMIMENAVLQPFTKIGDGCILSAGVNIAHGSRIDENVFLGSNATLAGCVSVGKNSFIGINACVRNDVKVAKFSMIGAGSYISRDTVPYGFYGTNGTVDAMAGRKEKEKIEVQDLLL